jgi:hypothetical protein
VPFLCTFYVTTQDLGDIIASSHSPERSIGVSWRFKIPWGYFWLLPVIAPLLPWASIWMFRSIFLSPCMLHPHQFCSFCGPRKVECEDHVLLYTTVIISAGPVRYSLSLRYFRSSSKSLWKCPATLRRVLRTPEAPEHATIVPLLHVRMPHLRVEILQLSQRSQTGPSRAIVSSCCFSVIPASSIHSLAFARIWFLCVFLTSLNTCNLWR